MTQTNVWRLMAAVIGLLLNLAPGSFAKSKTQDYPDYNRLEYAKPLPPPDQQVAAPTPGSIQMQVGNNKKIIDDVPPETLGIPIRARNNDSGSEPPISDLLDDYKITPSSPAAQAAAGAATVPATPPAADLH